MIFKRFPSIDNSYRKKFLDKIKYEGLDGGLFIVQEKVHGANFSFWINKDTIKCAKRSGFIKDDERFYSHDKVLDFYQKNLREMFEFLNKRLPEVEEVVVFGELYGGSYTHPEVPKSNERAVQKGVQYSAIQDFIAFDLVINGTYQPYDTLSKILDKHNIPYLKTLFSGTLQECLEYPNLFQTTLPKENGLPEIEDNVCEGVVIRPEKPLFLYDGSRVIIKNKNERFTEKIKNKKPKEPKIISEPATKAIEQVSEYINENRLRNVISKIGEIGQKDFSKLMKAFTADIIEEIIKDDESFFDSLGDDDQKVVNKHIGQQAALTVRTNFANIVDGTF